MVHLRVLLPVAPIALGSRMIHSGTPSDVPHATDCAIRKAAWEYGKTLHPERGSFKTLFDALQLGACDVPEPTAIDAWTPSSEPLPSDQKIFYVDPSNVAGNDKFATVADAVHASRSLPKPLTIALHGGTHFIQGGPIELTEQDSGLTIRNVPGEVVAVSGGRELRTTWTPSGACKGCYQASLKGQVDNVLGLRRNGMREIRARFPNFDPEVNSVVDGKYLVHDGETGWIKSRTNWFQSGAVNMNGVPGVWPPTAEATEYVVDAKDWPSVEWPMHIGNDTASWDAPYTGEGAWGQFWIGLGGTCVDREPAAGYWCAPNAPRAISTPNHPSGISPTTKQLPNSPYAHPEGAVVHAWRPGHWYTNIFEVGSQGKVPGEVVTEWEFYRNRNQVFGKCASASRCNEGITPLGYFDSLNGCQKAVNSTRKHKSCASYTWHHADADFGEFTGQCYCITDFVWGPQNQQNVDSGRAPGTFNGGTTEGFLFSRGGHQGGEGVTDGEAWYIENVLEELDMGREWYFDNRSATLYYKPNGTDVPTGSFVATSEKVLFNIAGTQKRPVRDIAIKGVTLRDTALAYFDAHGLPSGGDWALRKDAAVVVRGTEGVQLSSNLFSRLDGNAVFIGGYNRGLTIDGNEFFGIGDSALAAWGETSHDLSEDGLRRLPFPLGPDGRNGEQPRGTKVLNNIAHEIGLWQKQSSFWFQAVTAQTYLQGNVLFNGPRAALNFNDGFGGGDEITENLILNMCRESSDHGPWNSWDRVPYITDIRTGRASIVPADRQIHHNFVIATYNSQEAIDGDDGSSYFNVYNNFLAYADNGMKSDFGGHDFYAHGNVMAYTGKCYYFWPCCDDHAYNDQFYNNTCIFRESYGSDCKSVAGQLEVHSNRVFSKSGQLNVCGMDWFSWIRSGKTQDKDTVLKQWPSDEDLISWAYDLLNFSPSSTRVVV